MQLQTPVKQVAAIHDLSGFGRTSLSVVIPILSAMGIKVCPLPTAVLSAHSQYAGYHFIDLTDQMQPVIDHWKKLAVSFDAIYSGFQNARNVNWQKPAIMLFLEKGMSVPKYLLLAKPLAEMKISRGGLSWVSQGKCSIKYWRLARLNGNYSLYNPSFKAGTIEKYKKLKSLL